MFVRYSRTAMRTFWGSLIEFDPSVPRDIGHVREIADRGNLLTAQAADSACSCRSERVRGGCYRTGAIALSAPGRCALVYVPG
jgi:hypothetical protein